MVVVVVVVTMVVVAACQVVKVAYCYFHLQGAGGGIAKFTLLWKCGAKSYRESLCLVSERGKIGGRELGVSGIVETF